MKHLLKYAFLITSTGILSSLQAQEAKIFQEYKKDKSKSILPDFSWVGYKNGEVAIPKPKLKVFKVTDFGAVADDDKSDKDAIVKTVEAVKKNGSGIVFFPKGRFLINEDSDQPQTLRITTGNIIFRGSGSGSGGTEIFMKNSLQPADPAKMWSVPPMFIFGSNQKNQPIGRIISKAAVGEFKINLDNTKDLTAGDWILLELKSTDPGLLKMELGKHPADSSWTALVKGGVSVKVYHQIKNIKGSSITLNQPITYPIYPEHEWKVEKFACIEEVGIEDIAFVGNWKDKFVHHRSWMDDSGYTMMNLRQIVNSWITNCRFTDVSVAAIVNSGANISVLDCEVTGNAGHEAITNAGGTNVLLAKVIDEASQWHSVGTSKTSMNTVLWNVKYPPTTCFESHASQPRNTLLDGVEGGLHMNRGGGAIQNMPNHMQNLVMWNYKQSNEAYKEFQFWPETRWWKIPYPIIVGFHGAGTKFNEAQLKYAESIGAKVSPESLYEAQLKLRLGKIPAWLEDLKK